MYRGQKLSQEYDILSKLGYLKKDVPDYVVDNLNPKFKLRPYQVEALARFIHYFEENPLKKKPVHLLFNMATGSGKTLLMAANILYLYAKGYRNFLFFVNSVNIIEKTKNNFMNPASTKYLFNTKVKFNDREVIIREVSNFDDGNEDDINISFTTIQGLYTQLNCSKENGITFEDFREKKIVLISDEAHHINAWTRTKLSKLEESMKNTWEYVVRQILYSNPENVLLEYTATIDMENPAIYEKYKDKIIFEYDLRQFRIDGYSKEVKVLQADLENWERMLQAVILSQYRRKVAERHKVRLKPVILFKSKNIKQSKENFELFRKKIDSLTEADIEKLRASSSGTVLDKAFTFFKEEGISYDNLIVELKEDFAEEKCILLDSENIDKDKQIKLNTLEDENNEIRAIFAVKMLDEGWDVLNLFDIVRLYDTRDGKWTKDGRYIPGNTTLAERQLIGRGARYYPFKINDDDDPFKRKFDNQPDNPLRILEELYYHSKYNPRYIRELTATLKESGLLPYEEKQILLKIKPEIKETDFWKEGVLFLNRKIKLDEDKVRNLEDIILNKVYECKLAAELVKENALFQESDNKDLLEIVTKKFSLGDFGSTVIRKAMVKLEFYKFSNLKKYFPMLSSSLEFIDSLRKLNVLVTTSKYKLANLSPNDKLKICLNVLAQLQDEIQKNYVEYRGTYEFYPVPISKVVKDKILKINVEMDGDKEFGIPMSTAKNEKYRLNLKEKIWYVYEENYGTSEEKAFVKFINDIIDELRDVYEEVFLLRNAGLFKIYNFLDGKALEPDFVLFLKKSSSNREEYYQLFVEVKGSHLMQKDSWKENFLREIEERYRIDAGDSLLESNRVFKLMALPFYNESTRVEFENTLRRKLGLSKKNNN
ncbi:MAG: DEAD/DEAH box helicase family protein [Aquificae bacterium]|nr:DEAD/DEAH box helicase family protein [Aquificota bacterium]